MIMEIFDCFAIKRFSLILSSRLLRFKFNRCKAFLKKFWNRHVLCRNQKFYSEGIFGFLKSLNAKLFTGILLILIILFRPRMY